MTTSLSCILPRLGLLYQQKRAFWTGMYSVHLGIILAMGCVSLGCGGGLHRTDLLVPQDEVANSIRLDPLFVSASFSGDVDSPVFWYGKGQDPKVLVTAKRGNDVLFVDAQSGQLAYRRGATGREDGQLQRPNGIAITGDIAWIVERDNRRIQLFLLPAMESLGSFGQDVLRKPYGISVIDSAGADGVYRVYVTDDYGPTEMAVGRDGKVKIFDVKLDGTTEIQSIAAFGHDDAVPPLGKVESIMADPLHGRLLVADEEAKLVRVYSLAGEYLNVSLGGGLIQGDAEGIALYEGSNEEGYWILTDQGHRRNRFLLFARTDLSYIGEFEINGVSNTDGIAVTANAVGSHKEGVLFVVNDDAGLSAISWADLSNRFSLGVRPPKAGE